MKYRRKKLQEVDAVLYNGANYSEIFDFIKEQIELKHAHYIELKHNHYKAKVLNIKHYMDEDNRLSFDCNGKTITILPSDYLVLGTSGNFYAVSKKEFEDRFEKCED